VGTPHQVQSSSLTHLTFDSQVIPLSSTVTNLGVRFDPHLTFNDHIKHLFLSSKKHLQTPPHINPVRCREARPRLYLLKTGLLQFTFLWDHWQEHPEAAIHPKQRCQDPDESPEI